MESAKEDKTTVSVKMWRQSRQNLKLLAALEGKTMQEILDYVLAQALAEKQRKQQK